MKKYLFIFIYFILLKSYSQSKNTIYFYINPKDTLIKKQIATKTNEYEGYRIINEKRIVKKIKRLTKKKPLNKILKKGEIWVFEGDDIEYDTFDSFSFSFDRKKDSIISKSYLNTLNPIKDRRKLIDSFYLDNAWIEYIFIEPIKCDKFILRKVEILTFE